MPSGPAHADPAPEPGDPVPTPDWMTAADWEAWCDAAAPDDEPPDPDDEEAAPRWKVDQHPDGTFTWTTPSGRQYTTEPTRYPI